MAAYVAQRLGAVMVIMVAMSVLVFLATHALPSNAAALILGQYSTPETQAALEHKLGFDLPLPVQYWRWASHMLQGDMGRSGRWPSSRRWVWRSALSRRCGAADGRTTPHRSSPISASRCRSSIGALFSSCYSAAPFTCCLPPATPTSRTG